MHAPGFHTQTPNPFSTSQEYWKNSYSTVDKEAAGLVGANANFDFYGSNTGLISRAQMGSDDDEDEFSDGDGVGRGPSSSVQYALQMDVDTANTLARAKVEEQVRCLQVACLTVG